MKAAVMSLGSKSSLLTIEAMKKYFDSVENINLKQLDVRLGDNELEVLYNGRQLDKFNCIYAKGSFRFAPLLRSVTTAFYEKCYLPIKPNAFTMGHDKLLTHLALQYYKIPMPDTYVVSSIGAARNILGQMKYPIVLKFPHGTQGKGVMMADSFGSASSMMDALESLRVPFLIQEYIETEGVDLRAFVIGDKVVAAVKRTAIKGEKRANIHAGATGEPMNLDAATKRIAVMTSKSIGAEICAVDMLESATGPMVIEANVSPGLQGITRITGINIADKIAEFLFAKSKEFREQTGDEEAEKMFSSLGIKHTDKETHAQQIITNIDFRGDRILLPKIISSLAKLQEHDEVVIKAEKGSIKIERM